MLHKISFGLLRPEKGEQARKPLFMRRGTEPPRPPSPMDFDDGPLGFAERRASYAVSEVPLRLREPPAVPQRDSSYLNSRLEALSLEPLIAPSLQSVDHFARPVHTADALRPLAPPLRPPRSIERATTELVITPIPRRPSMARRAHSDRGRQTMPLRVQAVRRLHQAAMARALATHMEAIAQSRRASDEDGNESPLEPVELRAWEQRSAELVRWDHFSELPQVSVEDEPELDLFAEAFAQANFGTFDFSAPPSNDTTPRAVSREEYAPDAEDPFEFDSDSAYDAEYEAHHTQVPRAARRPAGNYI